MVLVFIDSIEAVVGAVIKELNGNQIAELNIRAHVDLINERSGPRNHISSDRKDSFKLNNVLQSLYQTASIRVSIPLIAYSLFVAVQRDDYIAPVFEHVSNNTISKQKLGQLNKRDKQNCEFYPPGKIVFFFFLKKLSWGLDIFI
eukprot:519789_1